MSPPCCAAHLHAVLLHHAVLELRLDLPRRSGRMLEQRAEGGAVDLDRLGRDRRLDGGGALRLRQHRHLADVIAGGQIGQHDVLAADPARHRDRALADEIDRIVLGALFDQRVVGLELDDLAQPSTTSRRCSSSTLRREIGLDLTHHRCAVDDRLDLGHRANQLDHRVAVDLEQQRRLWSPPSVAVRRRPEMRPISPKNSLGPSRTISSGWSGSTWIPTSPSSTE